MATPDMAQYLGVFLDEAQEQLGLLEANVLQMERGDHSVTILQVLFRAAHTLKGSSRAMGFLAIGDLTHEMENVLDDLRENKIAVTTAIVDALLECLDALTVLIESVAASGDDGDAGGKDIPALVTRLNALRTGPPSEGSTVAVAEATAATAAADAMPISDFEATAIAEARAAGLNVFHIGVALQAECLMKYVRVIMVFAALEPLGTLLVSNPAEGELEAERFDRSFEILFASEQTAEAIETVLGTISELDGITVSAWGGGCAAGNAVVAPTPVAPPPAAPAPAAAASPPAAASPTPSATATPPAASGAAPAAGGGGGSHLQTIRVDVARLDNLLNLIGELVIDRTQIARLGSELQGSYGQDERVGQLLETTHRIARITSELQDEIMKARMLPIDGVFQRMPRMVRDLAQKTGKEVEFQMAGGETELDRSVLESLGDPLIHLLRNSVDHGIEPAADRAAAGKPARGCVLLSARHEENHIVIEVSDDGKGMDPARIKAAAVKKGVVTQAAADALNDRDALNLIFASGFSTASMVSDISGRGVGMDIVRSNIERLGGRILVNSTFGAGSRFTIHLPLTLAIVRALLVGVDGGTYVLPLSSVVEMIRLDDSDELTLRKVHGVAVVVLRGQTVPLAHLGDVLRGDGRATHADRIKPDAYVVVVGWGEKLIGLCVDALVGEQDVVIKSLGKLLGDTAGLSGATILGDGRVALIVDIAKAVETIGRYAAPPQAGAAAALTAGAAPAAGRDR